MSIIKKRQFIELARSFQITVTLLNLFDKQVDIDGHPHPLKHQEGILEFIRPAKLVRQDRQLEELDDYEEYMKKHFSVVRNRKRVLGRGRSVEDNRGELEGSESAQQSETQPLESMDVAITDNHGDNMESMETAKSESLQGQGETKNRYAS